MMVWIRYLALICVCFDVYNALHWTSSGFNSSLETVISLKMTRNEPKIDVNQKDQIIILKDMRNYFKGITIYCFVGGYSDTSDIVFSFCKEQDCAGPYKSGGYLQNMKVHGMTAKIDTKFADRKGMRLELVLPSEGRDASGNFYCKAVDNAGHFSIRSNNIEIRDRIYWEQNLVQNSDNLKTIFRSQLMRLDLPATFACIENGLTLNPGRPEWIGQEFASPVAWTVCPVKSHYESLAPIDKASFSKCVEYTSAKWTSPDSSLRPMDIAEMRQWRFAVNQRGELTVFDMEPAHSTDLSYALMCYTKQNNLVQPINTFMSQYFGDEIASGIGFDGSLAAGDVSQLKAISPPIEHVNIFARVVPNSLSGARVDHVSIFSKYAASTSAKAIWYHNGIRLYSGDDKTCDKYKVDFIKGITSDMAGNYTLDVTDKAQKLVMTLVVSVLGPPILVNPRCLPIVKYIWENENATFSCHYKDRPEELRIHINLQEFKLDTLDKFMNTNLQQSYPYLAELRFNITPTNYVVRDTVTMTYSVYQLRKSLGQTKYQDHTVTFFVKNNYGLIVKSSSIYTVPKVKEQVQEFPDLSNCTTLCTSAETHHFRCRFNAKEYMNKELKVDHYWTINGHRLGQYAKSDNSFAPYFIADPITQDLSLLPINSNNSMKDVFVKEALKSNFIVCHIDLISVTDSMTSFSYRSIDDPQLNYKLRAKITLDYTPSNVAFISGIIIAIIILVIIAIVVVLIFYRMRSFGETYQLEKLEQKHGHNREQEVAELVFAPYQPDGEHHLENTSVDSEHDDNECPPDHGINTALIDEYQ